MLTTHLQLGTGTTRQLQHREPRVKQHARLADSKTMSNSRPYRLAVDVCIVFPRRAMRPLASSKPDCATNTTANASANSNKSRSHSKAQNQTPFTPKQKKTQRQSIGALVVHEHTKTATAIVQAPLTAYVHYGHGNGTATQGI